MLNLQPLHPPAPAPQAPVHLSPSTQAAINADLHPHVTTAPGGLLMSLGAIFELLAPILIKVLQDLAAAGVQPTAANVSRECFYATRQAMPQEYEVEPVKSPA